MSLGTDRYLMVKTSYLDNVAPDMGSWQLNKSDNVEDEESVNDFTHPALLIEPPREVCVVVRPPELEELVRLHARHDCSI